MDLCLQFVGLCFRLARMAPPSENRMCYLLKCTVSFSPLFLMFTLSSKVWTNHSFRYYLKWSEVIKTFSTKNTEIYLRSFPTNSLFQQKQFCIEMKNLNAKDNIHTENPLADEIDLSFFLFDLHCNGWLTTLSRKSNELETINGWHQTLLNRST